MICPNCGGNNEAISLLDDRKEPFEIDRCLHCGGIWLDREELDKISREKGEEIDTESESYDDVDLLGLNCPRCYVPLEEFNHSRLGHMAFLRCPDCHGFWLKRGQLFQYLKVKAPVLQKQPDSYGTLTRRDRMLVTFTSIIVMVILSGFLLSIKTGSLPLSADEPITTRGGLSLGWIVFLVFVLIVFVTGLILALFRSHRLVRLSGWTLVILSIVALAFLANL